MAKVYISGPISGYDYHERKCLFLRIQQELEKKGYEVRNPMFNGLPQDADTHAHMRADFKMLCECDTIVMLPRWTHSAGCTHEFNFALAIGCEVKFVQSVEPLIIVETKFQ